MNPNTQKPELENLGKQIEGLSNSLTAAAIQILVEAQKRRYLPGDLDRLDNTINTMERRFELLKKAAKELRL